MSFIDIVVSKPAEGSVEFDAGRPINQRLHDEIAAQIEAFLKIGGKITEEEPQKTGVFSDDIEDGAWTGITAMPDGTFKTTFRGRLVGKGYYASRKSAEAFLTKLRFKDGSLQ